VGLPTLILEISLGQCYQSGNVGVFGKMHARFRGVGMASVFSGFILVTYYSMLLSWVCNAFFDSFGDDDPWAKEGGDGSEAIGYFFNEIIGMDTAKDGSNRPSRIVPANAGYSALVWFLVWLCLAFGTEWTGRIAYITMGLPILFLFLFLFRSIALEGADDGIKEYIGKWEMDVLKDEPTVWSRAVSQIFFSLSTTMGTMPAYGSHCPRGEPAVVNSVVIGVSNCMFSIISGFAVFAAIGHLAHLQGVTVNDLNYATFSLVFGTWPVVLGQLKGGEHWVRLLFINLFMLGIDSAFSILEAPMVVVSDYFLKHDMKVAKWKTTTVFCIVAYLCSLFYATDAGLFFLDAVDYYINYTLLIMGLAETFGAGWIFGIEKQIEEIGSSIVFTFMLTNFGSVILACCLWFGLDSDNQVWAGFVALIGCYAAGVAVTLFFCSMKIKQDPEKWNWNSIIYAVGLSNVMSLREELESICGYMPWIWAFMMKHFIPQVLVILFFNQSWADNGAGKPMLGNYEGYENVPYQMTGIIILVFTFMLVAVGAVVPALFEPFDLTTVDLSPSKNIAADSDGSNDDIKEAANEALEAEA